MPWNEFHFAASEWLLSLLVIPLIWGVYFLFFSPARPAHRLQESIDAHLLPHLLVKSPKSAASKWKALGVWTLVWLGMGCALAGPRWSFQEIETYSKDQSLVILLDLSESMKAADVSPSRLVRAKHILTDLLQEGKGVKFGLVAFAADAHMITPLTEDRTSIQYLLPSLDTDLPYLQGSRLTPALIMARAMLDQEPGQNKGVVILTDGGFDDPSAMATIQELAHTGYATHLIGLGTLEGAPIPGKEGQVLKKNGATIISKMERDRLQEMAAIGKGVYAEGSYANAEQRILQAVQSKAQALKVQGKKVRQWEEEFYLFLLPAIPACIWWLRKGGLFALFLAWSAFPLHLQAAAWEAYFKNSEEQGKALFDEKKYADAAERFQDPYRQGVALYRAGNYAEAERLFRQPQRSEVAAQAAYNLGNALAAQNKIQEAIAAYEDVLRQWPGHTEAKENLEILKRLLEEQQQPSNEPNQDKNNQGQPEDKEEEQSSDQGEDSKQGEQSSDQEKSEESQERENDTQQVPNAPPAESEQPNENESALEPTKEEQQKTQDDLDADLWLNKAESNPKQFLKNKFYIKSKANGTQTGVDPW